MNRDGWTGFDNLSWWTKYWAWEALSHIENYLSNADEEDLDDGESDAFILNNLDEESLKELCIDMANDIGNYDGLWEDVWEYMNNSMSDCLSEGKYLDRLLNYKSIRTGGNTEGDNE